MTVKSVDAVWLERARGFAPDAMVAAIAGAMRERYVALVGIGTNADAALELVLEEGRQGAFEANAPSRGAIRKAVP